MRAAETGSTTEEILPCCDRSGFTNSISTSVSIGRGSSTLSLSSDILSDTAGCGDSSGVEGRPCEILTGENMIFGVFNSFPRSNGEGIVVAGGGTDEFGSVAEQFMLLSAICVSIFSLGERARWPVICRPSNALCTWHNRDRKTCSLAVCDARRLVHCPAVSALQCLQGDENQSVGF